jgi:hypothetical protein
LKNKRSDDALKRDRPLSNWAQILSAITSIATSIVTVWALFFSPASQTVIDFLQSELTIRNSRIVSLEDSTKKLNDEVQSRQAQLTELENKITIATASEKIIKDTNLQLEIDNKRLSAERNAIENEVEITKKELNNYAKIYDGLRLQYIAGKFYAKMQGVVVSTEAFRIIDLDGLPRTQVNLWGDYTSFVKEYLNEFKGEEKKIATEIAGRFVKNCRQIGDNVIVVGPIKSPHIPYQDENFLQLSSVEQDRLSQKYQNELGLFQKEKDREVKRVFGAEEKIRECMRSIR